MSKDQRQLYACFLSGQGNYEDVFHASFIERKGADLTIGTSRKLQRAEKQL